MNSFEFIVLFSMTALIITPIRFLLSRFERVEREYCALLRYLSSFNKRVERAYIARDIEHTINTFVKTVNSETGHTIFPELVKIQWVKGMDEKMLTKKGTVILRMRSCNNQAENLVKAICTFLSVGLMPSLPHSVHGEVLRSVKFILCEKMLKSAKRNAELRYFTSKILKPEIECNPEVKNFYSSFERFDPYGCFLDILLRELADISELTSSKKPNQDILNETMELASFIVNIMTKKRSIDVPLTYEGKFKKTSVVLVKKRTYERYALKPYVSRINRCIENQVQTIYVLGANTFNIEAVKLLTKNLENNENITKIAQKTYDCPKTSAKQTICVSLKNKNCGSART